MTHFRQNEALALAAYNAGPGRARRWWRAHRAQGAVATDVMVEEIPYRETQTYVKSVLASYGAYRYLYGPEGVPAFRSIPLEPELPQSLGPFFDRTEWASVVGSGTRAPVDRGTEDDRTE